MNKNAKMFLVSETSDPSGNSLETIYCCAPITTKEAKAFLAAMNLVKELGENKSLKAVGKTFGIELWRYARWLTPREGCEDKIKSAVSLDGETALLSGDPECWEMTDPELSRFDLQTVFIHDEFIRFQCYYKDSGIQLCSFDFDRGILEKAAKGLSVGSEVAVARRLRKLKGETEPCG
jgi:hypothetical protein